MRRFVRFGIDSGIQLLLLVGKSDHGLVDRDVIRSVASIGL